MSRLAGYSVLALSVLGLGTWGTMQHAQRMENRVRSEAEAIAAQVALPLEMSVSGRDISVAGVVETEAEAEAIRAALDGIEGRRVVRDALTLPPIADPHRLVVTRDSGGGLRAEGMVASQASRRALAARLDAASLELRRGAVPGWDQAAQAGADALTVMETGRAELTGDQLAVTGAALNPARLALTMAALNTVPEGVSVTHDIALLDDGQPFAFHARSGPDGVVANGKLPEAFPAADLELDDATLTRSRIAAPDGYEARVLAGVSALRVLEHGALEVDADGLHLTGAARDPQAWDMARAALGDVPGVSMEVALLDDGSPFRFAAQTGAEAGGLSAQGKLPEDLDLSDFALPQQGLVMSPLAGPQGYGTRVSMGLTALAMLDEGRLEVDADGLRLTGRAASQDARDAAIAVLPDGVQVDIETPAPAARVEPETPDVAEPAEPDPGPLADAAPGIVWTITEGVTSTPEPLSLQAIDAALRGQGEVGDLGDAGPVLAALAPWMLNVEAFGYGAGGLDLTLAPGVDDTQIRAALAETLGDLPLTIRMADLPEDGSERLNPLTGATERFTSGFWMPQLAFTPTREVCIAQADQVLTGGEITFLSGSATLDARATRAVNRLASVLRRCDAFSQAGIEIGGHTDSTGSADLNRRLSQDRAQAVADALTARGLDPARMTARGFGSEQPIADNATEEGRAANRRTTITWAE